MEKVSENNLLFFTKCLDAVLGGFVTFLQNRQNTKYQCARESLFGGLFQFMQYSKSFLVILEVKLF